MIIDKTLMVADDLAYNGTPTVIDLQSIGAAKGEPIRLFVKGSSTLATPTGFIVVTGTTTNPATTRATIVADIVGKIVEVIVPQNSDRYLKLTLTGSMSAGTWSAGVCAAPVQSNR